MLINILFLFMGVIIFLSGYFFCLYTNKQKEIDFTPQIKRVKTSFRNPLKTFESLYDDYKTNKGLYEPQKVKGGK